MQKTVVVILLCLTGLVANCQTASFTFQTSDGLYCSPSTVSFTQTSTGNPIGFSWDFGNGQTSFLPNPTITFSTAGTYIVKLLTVYNDQVQQTAQPITINPGVTLTLTANADFICQPGGITFTANNNGVPTSFDWNFGDGITLVTNTSTVTHNYATYGNFSVTVRASAVTGCFATSSYNVKVERPTISATLDIRKGCIPTTVNFNSSVIIPSGSTVTNYNWDFGDGTSLPNGTSPSTSHTYTGVLTYTPTLSITTVEGCTNNFTFPTVAFGTPPVNLKATSDKKVYCGSDSPIFSATATNANSYTWDFGDDIIETVLGTQVNHKYTTLGFKTVKVTPLFNGCAGRDTSFKIEIIGVIATFDFANTCGTKNSFAFTNTSQGNQSTIVWDFGDGSPPVTTRNATHTYPTSGTFTASLTITDSITGCKDVISKDIYTARPSLLNPDLSICRKTITTFDIQNNYANPNATYTWFVVGLPPVVAGPNYAVKASVHGLFTNNFVVINNGGGYCPDTLFLNHSILVRGPVLSFNAPPAVCEGAPFDINNTSSPFVPGDNIISWSWNYGQSPMTDPVRQPRQVVYFGQGTYNITLVAQDNKGCSDTLVKPIIVNVIPFLRILPRADTLCAGQKDTLIAYHEGSIVWSPSSILSCTTCDTVVVSPPASVNVFATATTTFGCTRRDSAIITVYQPFTVVPVANPIQICLTDTTRINVTPSGKVIVWSPATYLSNANAYNPVVKPLTSTTYTASLVDSVGCFSGKANISVIVKSLPTVNAGPDLILPYGSPFSISPIYSSNAKAYMWTPARLLNCATCPVADGIAFAPQNYAIKVTSDSGCVARDSVNVYVECKFGNILIPSAFTPNGDFTNDVFYPMTRGIQSIKRFTVFNRFGQVMFTRSNFSPNERKFGWDGRFNGIAQAQGSYVYILEAVCDLSETFFKKGSVLLLR